MSFPMRRLLAFATVLMAAQAQALEFPLSPFDIKGAKLGDSIDLKDTQFPGVTCKTIGRGVEDCSNPNTTIGGSSAAVRVVYLDGRIVRITYSDIDIATKANVDAALAQKYGEAKISDSRPVYQDKRCPNTYWENDQQTQLTSKSNWPKKISVYTLQLINHNFYNAEVIDNRINGITPESVDI